MEKLFTFISRTYPPNHVQLYPYHISDVLIKGLRVPPFKYYLEMMYDIMSQGTCELFPDV